MHHNCLQHVQYMWLLSASMYMCSVPWMTFETHILPFSIQHQLDWERQNVQPILTKSNKNLSFSLTHSHTTRICSSWWSASPVTYVHTEPVCLRTTLQLLINKHTELHNLSTVHSHVSNFKELSWTKSFREKSFIQSNLQVKDKANNKSKWERRHLKRHEKKCVIRKT